MRNYAILTRTMLRNMIVSMNPLTSSYEDGKKKNRAIVRTVLIALVILTSIGSVIYIEYLIHSLLGAIGMRRMLPQLAIFISIMFTLLLGLFQGLSELFQGKDAPFLAVLPLTSRAVFAARMTTLYVSEMLVNALICIPAFVLYGIGSGSAFPAVLTALPVLLALPLIPLSIVAVVSSLLMRIGALARHRDTVVMILSMALALAYSMGVTLMNSSQNGPQDLAKMVVSPDGLMMKVMGFFPPVIWATDGFTGQVSSLLLFLGVSILAVCGAIALVGPGYLNIALSSTERTVSRKKGSRAGFGWQPSGAFRTLHALEWKELLRTPAWAYNSLFGVVMFPLMISVGMIAGASKGDANGIQGLQMLLKEVDPGYIATVTAGILMFGCMVNPAVSTAISREGGRWPFALTLPVRQRSRFLAKLLVGVEINAVCSALIAAAGWFMLRIPVLWLLAALAVAMLVGVAAAALSLWVDALRPQLHWNTEMEAIKKNFNQVFGMMLWVVLVGLCVVPAVLLWQHGGSAALGGAAGVALLETVVSLLLLMKVSERHLVLSD